jgi:hypothetical protein
MLGITHKFFAGLGRLGCFPDSLHKRFASKIFGSAANSEINEIARAFAEANGSP